MQRNSQRHLLPAILAGIVRLLLGMSLAVAAETPAPSGTPESTAAATLTLDAARQLAFQNNWDLLAARSDLDIARAQQLVAKEFPNPTVSFLSSKITLDRGRGTTAGNDLFDRGYDTVAAVSQLVEIGGKRSGRQTSAAAGTAAAEARFHDARRLLDQGVAHAFITALQNQAMAEILRRSAASLLKEADIAKMRLKAGDISTSDEIQIEVAAARLEQDSRAAETSARTSRVVLQTLLGVRLPDGNIKLEGQLEMLASEMSSDAQNAPLAAVETRPDVLATLQLKRKAEADLRLQKALRMPDPTFTVQYEREPPDTPQSIGLGISFPLPLWSRNTGNINAAAAARKQAELAVEKTRGQAVAEVVSARLGYTDAVERFDRYQKDIAPKSAKVRETVAYAYQHGGASLLDLLSAERTDNEVRLASLQAAADAATAAADLKAAFVSQPLSGKAP